MLSPAVNPPTQRPVLPVDLVKPVAEGHTCPDIKRGRGMTALGAATTKTYNGNEEPDMDPDQNVSFQLSEIIDLPTVHGQFQARAVRDADGSEHLVVFKGAIEGRERVPVRIHSECLTGDTFHSLRCDCGPQLGQALEYMEQQKLGLLIYLRQEGRGIGLYNKLMAYALQEQGFDTVQANINLGLPSDMRQYDLAAAILDHLNIRSVCLLTNNPQKIDALRMHNIEVAERIPLYTQKNSFNEFYLETKKEKMSHML